MAPENKRLMDTYLQEWLQRVEGKMDDMDGKLNAITMKQAVSESKVSAHDDTLYSRGGVCESTLLLNQKVQSLEEHKKSTTQIKFLAIGATFAAIGAFMKDWFLRR